MEDSNTFDSANDSATDTSDNSVCDVSVMDSDSMEDGGYIESKAPDVDESDTFMDEEDKPVFSESIMKYLDEITEKDEGGKKPAVTMESQPRLPRTREEEEAAIISSIPSERGRERIKAIIGAKNEAEERYRHNEGVLDGLRNLVRETGVPVAELAQNIEYSSLLAKGDENSLRVALEMLENQREMVCKRLNVNLPGVDLLSDFPDLKAAVERREITPQHAARLAKYERSERENLRQREERENYDRENARYVQDLQQTKHAITSYLQSRAGEADHVFKVTRLKEHLSRPGVLQELTQNLDSRRLFSQIRFMYDNIVVPPMRAQPRMQPIRSRPTMQGPVSSRPDATLIEKMSDIMDSMGI